MDFGAPHPPPPHALVDDPNRDANRRIISLRDPLPPTLQTDNPLTPALGFCNLIEGQLLYKIVLLVY